MAHYITFANSKGGVGKTTSAIMCGLVLAGRGQKVEIRDTDPSGGATEWKRLAAAKGDPLPFAVHSANIKEVADPPEGDAEWVLIDTPPLQSEIIQNAVEAADIVVITTQTGKLDVQRAIETAAAVDKPLTVLVTRVNDRTTEWRNCQDMLAEAGLSRMEAYIKNMESVRKASGTADVPHGTGYQEVVDELQQAFRD